MVQLKAGVINVTGYIGCELARLLHQHPQVELKSVTGRSTAGKMLRDVFPHFANTDYRIEAELDANVDIIFSAMPHKTSVNVIPPLLTPGIKVIDVSADFRLKDERQYPKWYGFTHPMPELLKKAVYGLPELHRTDISTAQLVANPGCYSTGAILALAPAVKRNLIYGDIVIDSKSGISGAGRSLNLSSHYAEANENTCAYAIEGHRHLAEIEQELHALDPELQLSITFVPHLVPMTRGILTSSYATLKKDWRGHGDKAKDELQQIYKEFYQNAPFIKIVSSPPQTRYAWGTNYCFIYPTIDVNANRLIIISSLDNLVKGGAGQALQNMNIAYNFPETAGLESLAVSP
ncbi:MAG: N-acetyl-gamma-glutamyl-phosphate reductase [Chloroflexota bacterium]|nr:N-acetyl-gamma-glutamyl-phosphate reductase [Chloroflexota bacterium]